MSPTLLAGAWAPRDYLAPRFAFEEVPEDADCDPALAHGTVGHEAIVGHLLEPGLAEGVSSGRVLGLSLVENTATDDRTLSRLEPLFELAATL
ncbi:MAG TPA: hypothetical protein VMV90_03480 [Rectinemataceae bacterium]|nr:hypothetical protein [Rectinemataceae bacterium]